MPFATGTQVEVGPKGLHADNMNSVDGGSLGVASFTGQATVPASIDLWADAGTPVYPVAAGTVRSAWAKCDVVVIDHGDGVWSEYLHVSVSPELTPGHQVTPSTTLGTVLPAVEATACGQDAGGEDHLHFALAQASDANAAAWVKLAGHSLCGHEVNAAGDLVGLANRGATFTVPDCGGPTAQAATPTPTPSPTPSPMPTATPAPVLAASWSSPKDGAKLTSSTLKLSAKASFSPATESVKKVAFTVKWGSTTKAACSATKAGSNGAWSCKADLWKLGAPLGKLILSFDVTDSAGGVAKAPAGTRSVTFAARPASPNNVGVAARGSGNKISCDTAGCYYEPPGGPSKWRLTWQDVAGETGYRVYVRYGAWVWSPTNCADFIRMPRQLLATLPANTTRLDGTWTAEGDGSKEHPLVFSDTYYVVAFNGAGESKPAVSREINYLDSGPSCTP